MSTSSSERAASLPHGWVELSQTLDQPPEPSVDFSRALPRAAYYLSDSRSDLPPQDVLSKIQQIYGNTPDWLTCARVLVKTTTDPDTNQISYLYSAHPPETLQGKFDDLLSSTTGQDTTDLAAGARTIATEAFQYLPTAPGLRGSLVSSTASLAAKSIVVVHDPLTLPRALLNSISTLLPVNHPPEYQSRPGKFTR